MLQINKPRYTDDEINLIKYTITEFVKFVNNYRVGIHDVEIDTAVQNYYDNTIMVEIISNVAYETMKYERAETFIGYGSCEQHYYYNLLNLHKEDDETFISSIDYNEFIQLNSIIDSLIHIANQKNIRHTDNFIEFLKQYRKNKIMKDYSSVSNFLDYLYSHDDIRFITAYTDRLDELRIELNDVRKNLASRVIYCYFNLPKDYDNDNGFIDM